MSGEPVLKERGQLVGAAGQPGAGALEGGSGGGELCEEVAGSKHISVILQIYPLDRQALFGHAAGKTSMPAPAPSPRIRRLADLGPHPPASQRLQAQLAQSPWICQGSLVCRPLLRRVGRRKGRYYLWTCKLKGKTVCVALSRSQYLLLAQAIRNNRRTQKLLERMQALTLKTILRKVPGVRKRK